MFTNGLGYWRRGLSRVALALAALHLIVAFGVATLPPPTTSEGGPIAGLLYATYYAVPLAILGFGLWARGRWTMALLALLALALMVLHSAPLLTLQLPLSGLPWQQMLAGVLSALSGLVEAAIFVVALATVLALGRPRRTAGSSLQ